MSIRKLSGLTGVLFVMVAAPLFAILALRPPAPVPATAPDDVFSAERAMRHVSAIAEAPRPVGSAAHAAARAYLIAELTRLGLEPRVQTVALGAEGDANRVQVHNVMVRLDGTDSTGGVLLVSHYDSVRFGPGAADAAAAVAALLEAGRALRAGGRLENDVILLFSDGEEAFPVHGLTHSLAGARAFVADHPWMADVALVLNFDARGSSGPSIMFETSRAGYPMIAAFARAVPRPVANAFAPTIYEFLPNDTDFSVFKGAGAPGFNFAFIDGFGAYHTGQDTIANLDRRSLQHHGQYALALARYFGGLDLQGRGEGSEAIYFDLLARILVHYPVWLGRVFAVVTVLVFVAVLAAALKSGRVSLGGVAGGFLFVVGTTAAVVIGLRLLGRAGEAFDVSLAWPGLPTLGVDGKEVWCVLGLWLLTAALFMLVTGLRPRRLATAEIAAGAVFVLVLIASALSFGLPGASQLVQWNALFALTGLHAAFGLRPSGRAARAVLLALPLAPIIMVSVPGLYLMFVALIGMGPGVASAVVVIGSWLSFWGVVPLLDVMAGERRLLLGAALAALGAAIVIGTIFL